MNIFRTFEILLSEPISVIRKRIIHILHVETNIFTNKVPIELETSKTSTQITVFNNMKMYNLLSTVVHKKALAEKAQENDNKTINGSSILLLEDAQRKKVER